MEYESLLFEISDGVATVTLNRSSAANAIDMTLARELMQVSLRCDDDPEIRAVVLTGAGKFFSAGGDLKSFRANEDAPPGALKELVVFLHAAVSNFARMSAPLVTAVGGAAAGAGMSLAVLGDLVLAAESARFTMAYTAAGLSPDGSSTYFLPRLIGLRRAKELMLTNRVLDAAEALDWGLVTRVVPDAMLIEEATSLARTLAQGPTRAYGQVKALLNESFGETLETQMEREARSIGAALRSTDGREGVRAFTEKRKPRFVGA